MKLTVIPVVVGVLGTVPKNLKMDWMNWKLEELKLSRPQTTKIGQDTNRTEICCQSDSSEKLSVIEYLTPLFFSLPYLVRWLLLSLLKAAKELLKEGRKRQRYFLNFSFIFGVSYGYSVTRCLSGLLENSHISLIRR